MVNRVITLGFTNDVFLINILVKNIIVWLIKGLLDCFLESLQVKIDNSRLLCVHLHPLGIQNVLHTTFFLTSIWTLEAKARLTRAKAERRLWAPPLACRDLHRWSDERFWDFELSACWS